MAQNFRVNYYPFGLTFNTFSRVGLDKNEYLYQGKEEMEGTDFYDFHARSYHAGLGRFMQVDPLYNGPSGFVGMNNNPISTIDPNGEEPITIGVAIAIGAAVSAVSYTASIALSDGGFNNWDWGQFAQGVVIGAASGAVTFGIGTGFDNLGTAAVEAGKASKLAIIEVGRLASHATFQGGLSAAQGGDFLSAFASGATGGIVGLGTSGLEGAGGDLATIGSAMLLGGVTADATGGDFWKGAAQAGIVAGANHVAHRIGRNFTERIAEKKRIQQQRLQCPDCELIARGVRSFFSEYFGASGNEAGQFINNLKSIPSSGVLIIGPGGQLYEIDFGQGSASGKITTLDLSDPDNFLNNISLIKSQGKTAVKDALIIGFYEDNPLYSRNEHGYRNFVKSDNGLYYSPFKQLRGPNWEVIYYKPQTYSTPNGREVHTMVPVN